MRDLRRALAARLPPDRALLEWLGVCVLTLAFAAAAATTDLTRRLDNMVYDALASASRGSIDPDIVIVAIDDRSLEALGRWPWSRDLHARMIDRLDAAGARAVAYDILFPEHSPADPTLAGALRRAGNVYLPLAVDPLGQDGRTVEVIGPTAGLRAAAAGVGHVNLAPDEDGVVRRLPLRLRSGDRVWPHLLLPLLGHVGPEAVPPPANSASPTNRLIAGDPVLLRWRGGPGSFPSVSFIDAVNGEVPAPVFAGKIVLVGMTSSGQGDRYATPLSREGGLSPGVDLQATLLNTLLADDAPATADLPTRLAATLIPVLIALCGFLFLRPTRTLLLAGGLAGAVAATSAVALMAGGLWLPPSAAVLGLGLSWPLWSWRRLAAASAFMSSELEKFERSGDALVLRPAGSDVVGRQVEAMKAALQRLRDLRQFISDTLQSLPDATLVFDATGRLVLSNPAAEQMLDGRLVDGGDGAPLFELLDIPGLADLPVGEVRAHDGRVLDVNESPLVTGEGVFVGRVVRVADVTEARTAQRQREQALQLLSHDMRAPQAAILALLEQSADNPAGLDVTRVAQNARRTIELADDFVQLARAENQALRWEEFDLGDVLVEAVDGLWSLARNRDVEIIVTGADRSRRMCGDRHLIARAVCNLIDNAIKFSPAGGTVLCKVSRREEEVDRLLTVVVEDEGPGVPADLRPHLFEPFRQGSGSKSAIGLGLALVRTVADRHGGRVSHMQRSPRGSRFLISFPVEPGRPA